MSGWYTKYPDKMSGWSGKCLDDLKSVCMIWKVARQSKINLDNLENVPGWYGKCPDDLKSVWITVLNFACIQLKCSSANSFPYKCTQWSIFEPFLCLKSCKNNLYAHLSQIWKLARCTCFIRKVFTTKILLFRRFLLFLTYHRHNRGYNFPSAQCADCKVYFSAQPNKLRPILKS